MNLNQSNIDRALGDTPASFSACMQSTLNHCVETRRAPRRLTARTLILAAALVLFCGAAVAMVSAHGLDWWMNNRWLYMCEEKGNKVLYFQFDENTGKMNALQELSTVPETVTGYSDASEVMIDPTGQYVLVSNRYTDSMAIYRIDPVTGYLKTTGFAPCLGKTPRFFCFAPNGKCYVANEDSDTIIEFQFDAATGLLIPTLNIIPTGSPVCVTFL